MKIWVHGYQLKPKAETAPVRHGALLKVEWASGQIGYSDLHPWPEFGEPPLDTHLEALAGMTFTRLAEVSLEFNYIDREFRLMRRNAFLGLIIPRSHYLFQDIDQISATELKELEREGYSHIKVKMGRDFARESVSLLNLVGSTRLFWRLDFNGRLSVGQVREWWNSLNDEVRQRIDFIEDPVAEGELEIDGPWANDWYKQSRSHIRIIKPAREGIDEVGSFRRIIFTHGLDHTLGQACSAWTAGKFYATHPRKIEVCGLSSNDVYEPDDFSRQWLNKGPRMKPTTGTGFGFDEILESIKWERLF